MSVIQSTKSFSQQQHLNGGASSSSSAAVASTSMTSSADVLQEMDGDVEMNGSSQNGSSHQSDPLAEPNNKEDSLLDMGIKLIIGSFLLANVKINFLMQTLMLLAPVARGDKSAVEIRPLSN